MSGNVLGCVGSCFGGWGVVPGVLGYARFVRGRSRSGMVELILDVFYIIQS